MKIGSLVECINDLRSYKQAQEYISDGNKLPVKNRVYTVRSVDTCHNGKPGIRLMEIHNPIVEYKGGFSELRFRPVDFREVDCCPESISIEGIIFGGSSW